MATSYSSFDDLIDRFVADRLRPEEVEQFFVFLEQKGFLLRYEERLDLDFLQKEYGGWSSLQQPDELYVKIRQAAGFGNNSVHCLPLFKRVWVRYAAAAVILISIGTYLLKNSGRVNHENEKVAEINSIQNNISPGGEKAVLTLADGSTIILDSAANGQLAQQLGAKVLKLSNGELKYEVNKIQNNEAGLNNKVVYNTMTTPKGGQYKLTLPDGSKAWLNAASSITYPTAFKGQTREVKITGEVYFEIARNSKQPFKVHVAPSPAVSPEAQRRWGGGEGGGFEIEVLGTSFNINAYEDEVAIKTSLLEGSVKIGNQILKPGQAFLKGKIIKTDIDQDIAWKNGFFNLNDLSVPEAMRQLARWYDIEIRYDKGIPTGELFGKIGRKLSLNEVLDGLEGTVAYFQLEGKYYM